MYGSEEDFLLPPTQTQKSQPLSSDDECNSTGELSEAELKTPWGRLKTCLLGLQSLDLFDDSYTLGRHPDCEIIADDEKIWENVQNVSKRHFTITKDGMRVYIADYSKNGTFVNRKRVGKGNKVILNSGDMLALGTSNQRCCTSVFIFENLCQETDFLPRELVNNYKIDKIIGRGAYGEVRLCYHRQTSQRYAVKRITKSSSSNTSSLLNRSKPVSTEIEILKQVSNPFIVRMLDFFDCDTEIFIVLEYMSGGDLQGYLRGHDIDEDEVKMIFYQVLSAIQHLHSQHITHRDLKPENVLVCPKGDLLHVKLSDFGLSKIVNGDSMMETNCGTLYYVAPEIINRFGKYDQKVDVWSLGVMLYFMLTKKLPFTAPEPQALACKIMAGRIDWHDATLRAISPPARDLLKKLLTVDPKCRIFTDNIFRHEWIREDYDLKSTVRELQNYKTEADILNPPKRAKMAW